MDNPDARRWGPPFLVVALGWVATAAALAWVITAQDPGGRLFGGITVVVCATCAGYGSRARPRLMASSAGIEVRGLGGARRYPWARVAQMRLLHTRGLAGRRSTTLEITIAGRPRDEDERLLIFGRLDLGADPREVADELAAVRSSPGTAQAT